MFVAERFLSGLVKVHGKHVSGIYRWRRYMVPNGMQVLETESPHPFFFKEKPD
jgi:hypothetical protein